MSWSCQWCGGDRLDNHSACGIAEQLHGLSCAVEVLAERKAAARRSPAMGERLPRRIKSASTQFDRRWYASRKGVPMGRR